ncbi:Protein of unknown function DUF2078, membrane [Pseudodesulfovibrio mercurii]|uniref:SHOCT domain-containing protein n=1 Tax=Pseudodesulfovibrio mercurii TaxID=641491 RepID=F0JJS2_9BACT|nr:SHOCT domain-containing protein [Pseudodesulfovibrio mercurii]EGB16171.1 Protein of unknown function DUF2078, membrane [Pseudodesulfovibrio mercurii]
MTDILTRLTAQQPMYNGGGPNAWGGGMMYSPFGGWFMILLLVAAVVVVALLLRGSPGRNNGGNSRGPSGETPLDILKRRYAAGEIDKAQFEEMKRDLTAK